MVYWALFFAYMHTHEHIQADNPQAFAEWTVVVEKSPCIFGPWTSVGLSRDLSTNATPGSRIVRTGEHNHIESLRRLFTLTTRRRIIMPMLR